MTDAIEETTPFISAGYGVHVKQGMFFKVINFDVWQNNGTAGF